MNVQTWNKLAIAKPAMDEDTIPLKYVSFNHYTLNNFLNSDFTSDS